MYNSLKKDHLFDSAYGKVNIILSIKHLFPNVRRHYKQMFLKLEKNKHFDVYFTTLAMYVIN